MHIVDHLGNEYESKTVMAHAYGLTLGQLNYRLKTMSLANALTYKEVQKREYFNARGKQCEDENGVKYPSISAMCKARGVNKNWYYYAVSKGYSIDKIFKGPSINHRTECLKDRLRSEGVTTVIQLCKKYGVNHNTFQGRLSRGMSCDEALSSNLRKIYDHLGNSFNTEKDMCEYHGINYNTYRTRVQKFGKADMKLLLSNERVVVKKDK